MYLVIELFLNCTMSVNNINIFAYSGYLLAELVINDNQNVTCSMFCYIFKLNLANYSFVGTSISDIKQLTKSPIGVIRSLYDDTGTSHSS